MTVLPADGDLQHEMQIVEPDRQRNLDAADDRRHDLVDGDVQPRNVGHFARRYSAACRKVSMSSRDSRSMTRPSLITQVRCLPPCSTVMSASGSLFSTIRSANLPGAISPTCPSRPTAKALSRVAATIASIGE